MSRALRSGHGFGHLLDDGDERFLVFPLGIADWLNWLRHLATSLPDPMNRLVQTILPH